MARTRTIFMAWAQRRADLYNVILYFGSDAKLHQLAYHPWYGPWWSSVLPASPPQLALHMRPSAYVRPDGIDAIVYVDFEGVIRELSLIDGAWVDAYIPVGVLNPGQLFAHGAAGDRSSITFRGSTYGVVHGYELSRPVGGAWSLQVF
jgi:hypothetical protein